MIDVANERLISLAQASQMLPPGRRGRPVTISCLLRWILSGVKTPAGVVKLEGVRMGGRWLVSKEALARFAANQTPAADVSPAVPRSPGKRRRAAQRADKLLKSKGC